MPHIIDINKHRGVALRKTKKDIDRRFIERNSDSYKEWQKEYDSRPERKDSARNTWLIRKYGITTNDYDKILFLQGGTCGICHKENPVNKRLYVDHDHFTGKVRGVLCHRCNTLLGHSIDDIKILESAINYLKANYERAKTVLGF